MTRKATPFARHPLPSPGSPVCVCLGAGQLRGAGGRGAGCAGLRPFLSSGGSLWGCASGEVCWLPPLRSSEGREEAWQLGSKGALGHLGPFHPEPGHIPSPASSLRTQRCAAGACALPSCPRPLPTRSMLRERNAGAGEGRPHTALGAMPRASSATSSLSPAPGAGFVPGPGAGGAAPTLFPMRARFCLWPRRLCQMRQSKGDFKWVRFRIYTRN